jgi:hypothetical protein
MGRTGFNALRSAGMVQVTERRGLRAIDTTPAQARIGARALWQLDRTDNVQRSPRRSPLSDVAIARDGWFVNSLRPPGAHFEIVIAGPVDSTVETLIGNNWYSRLKAFLFH